MWLEFCGGVGGGGWGEANAEKTAFFLLNATLHKKS